MVKSQKPVLAIMYLSYYFSGLRHIRVCLSYVQGTDGTALISCKCVAQT